MTGKPRALCPPVVPRGGAALWPPAAHDLGTRARGLLGAGGPGHSVHAGPRMPHEASVRLQCDQACALSLALVQRG